MSHFWMIASAFFMFSSIMDSDGEDEHGEEEEKEEVVLVVKEKRVIRFLGLLFNLFDNL